MRVYRLLVMASWIVFFSYWWISSRRVKRNIVGYFWRSMPIRGLIGLIVLLTVLALRKLGVDFRSLSLRLTQNVFLGASGLVICLSGMAFACWARVHLGRNWGMPMAVKEDAELVTTGPYAFVRHPIYTGILAALLGSALVVSPWLVLGVVLAALFFVYCARTEEKDLLRQFPEEYPAYMRRTKMLIPFLL